MIRGHYSPIFFELVFRKFVFEFCFFYQTVFRVYHFIARFRVFVTQWANEVIDCPETASKISVIYVKRSIFCLWFREALLLC